MYKSTGFEEGPTFPHLQGTRISLDADGGDCRFLTNVSMSVQFYQTLRCYLSQDGFHYRRHTGGNCDVASVPRRVCWAAACKLSLKVGTLLTHFHVTAELEFV
jgi:hypothetical protein